MKHLFIPYDLAVLAKEKGFNELCLKKYNIDKTLEDGFKSVTNMEYCNDPFDSEYNNICAAPLYQQIVDWFREKEIKIIENPKIGYDIYLELNGGFFQDQWFYNIDKAIEEAFKLI